MNTLLQSAQLVEQIILLKFGKKQLLRYTTLSFMFW